MDLTAAVVIILASLPVPSVDRHEERRGDRLQSIAVAITRAAEHATCAGEFVTRSDCRKIASDPNQVAAELVVLADAETALRSNVHRGECEPHQCDASRYVVRGIVMVVHRARGLWQLHRAPTWSTADWASLDGASQTATSNGAWIAAKLLAGYRGSCGGGVAHLLAMRLAVIARTHRHSIEQTERIGSARESRPYSAPRTIDIQPQNKSLTRSNM